MKKFFSRTMGVVSAFALLLSAKSAAAISCYFTETGSTTTRSYSSELLVAEPSVFESVVITVIWLDIFLALPVIAYGFAMILRKKYEEGMVMVMAPFFIFLIVYIIGFHMMGDVRFEALLSQ